MKYKLIKRYPGSPTLNTIIDDEHISNMHLWSEFWQLIPEECAKFEITNKINGKIVGIKRIDDGVYFGVGSQIKISGQSTVGCIYGFDLIDGKLKIDHTFSYILNCNRKYDHLKYIHPCIYTQEDMDKVLLNSIIKLK